MEKGLKLEPNEEHIVAEPYRELLGSLMYVMMSTRPDICYQVGYLGRFQQQPGQQHWIALKRHLQGSKQLALKLKRCGEAKRLNRLLDSLMRIGPLTLAIENRLAVNLNPKPEPKQEKGCFFSRIRFARLTVCLLEH